jgi:phosphoglycerol transferase MdoB-like AlkP superfamily enzyme
MTANIDGFDVSFGMRKRSLLILPLLLGTHLALRLGFWWYNHNLFEGLPAQEKGWVFIRGLQQDAVSLLLVNAPVILLLLIRAWLDSPRLRHTLSLFARVFFIIGNILAIALNCIDIGYYRFGRHRANLDLDYVLRDSMPSFRSVIFGYWYLLLLFSALVYVIIRLARWLPDSAAPHDTWGRLFLFLRQAGIAAVILFSMGLIGKGRPVMPSTPLLSLPPAVLPLAQNSVLTWAYSCFHRSHELQPLDYFSDDEVLRLAPAFGHISGSGPDARTPKKNVVLFILESFSRCYVMPGDPYKANTPFLDSLLGKSLFFPQSFANGFSSNQGIVAILGGLPALMDEPFYYSEYANTPLRSLGNILGKAGYNTNFFMGAGKDHFGFGTFAHMAGIDHSYWREDFNDDRFYDGNWGIFDEPFLQYGGRILSAKRQPFLGVFFTISAHPPYTIPAALRQNFAVTGKTPAQQAIAYTDFSLKEFFASNRDKPWFRNTIFVFCADHWLDPRDGNTPFSCLDVCTIPIFIYDPATDRRDWRQTVAGQVDIVPTILDKLGFDAFYTGFGRSLLDSTIQDSSRYVVNRPGGTYQIIDKEYILGFDVTRDKSSYLYHYSTDSACRNDLLKTGDGGPARKKLERLLRANIQSYRSALTSRRLQ